MPRTRNPYLAEIRCQIAALARAGRSAGRLARNFGPCVATIHGRIKQADRDGGNQDDGLTSGARDELHRLRREKRQLSQESRREISWERLRPGLLEATRWRPGLRVHDRKPDHNPVDDWSFPGFVDSYGLRDSSR